MIDEKTNEEHNQEGLDEMFDDMQGKTPEPEEPKEETSEKKEDESPKEEDVKEEVKEKPEPVEEPAQEDEEPVRESSSKEDKDNKVQEQKETKEQVEKDEEPQGELENLRAQLAARDKTIESMSHQATSTPKPKTFSQTPKEQEPKGNVKPPPEVPQNPSGVRKFITKENYAEVMKDPAKFNGVLSQVYNTAVENTIVNVPRMVQKLINQQTTLNAKVDDFYKKHNDLVPYRKFIGFVANELSSKNPTWGLDELFDNVEKETRKRLSLNKATNPSGKGTAKTKPAFAKTKKSATRDNTQKPITDLEKELKDLM